MQGLSVDKREEELKVKRCIRCQELLSPNHDYCPKCGLTREVESILLAGEDRDRDKEKEKVKRLEEEVNRLTLLVEELLKRRSLL
jgi:K+-sensing histidine kinase KdpD